MTEKRQPDGQRKRGAQPGNKNALRTGKRTDDPYLALIVRSLDDDQREALLPLIKAYAADAPSFEKLLEDGGLGKVTRFRTNRAPAHSFDQASIHRHTETDESKRIPFGANQQTGKQANNGPQPGPTGDLKVEPQRHREIALIRKLVDRHKFLGATEFVEAHGGGLTEMERVVEELEDMQEAHPDQSPAYPGRWLRKEFHRVFATQVGRARVCQHCGDGLAVVPLPPAVRDVEAG